jgi:CBS domain-containing protein
MLLALFIYAAAKSELFTLTARMVLKGLKARDVMDSSVPAVREEAPISEAVMLMIQSRQLVLPVAGKNESYGFITAAQISRVPKEARDTVLVASLRQPALRAVPPDQDLSDVMLKAMQSQSGALPVIQDHLLIGLIRTSDILELMQLRQLEWEEPSAASWSLPVHHAPSR